MLTQPYVFKRLTCFNCETLLTTNNDPTFGVTYFHKFRFS